jgi:predicted metal-dependent hydrolase
MDDPAPHTFLSVNGRQLPLDLVRHPRARRYVLRLRPDSTVRVTIPRGGSVRQAREFAEGHRAWLENQLHKLAKRPPHPREWRLGGEVWLRGEPVKIEEAIDEGSGLIRFGPERLRAVEVTGDLRPIIERHLWKLATQELPPRVVELAAREQLSVRRVTVRNQRTRWGSCSRLSVISLNWRLVQVPPFVRDYVILHELCHLRHMNHSPRFWAEVARICPDHLPAEHWLRTHAVRLR